MRPLTAVLLASITSFCAFGQGYVITTLAGTGITGFSGDKGPAIKSELNGPKGVAVDSAGNLYFADAGNGRIRKVSNGVITTVAGNGPAGSAATTARPSVRGWAIYTVLPRTPPATSTSRTWTTRSSEKFRTA